MNRNIDTLGRLVIPKEMRTQLDIKENDPLNIELQDNKIIITKTNTVDYKARIDKAIENEEEIMYLANKVAITTQNVEIKAVRDRLEEIFKILKGE